jgi:hypothetical protein
MGRVVLKRFKRGDRHPAHAVGSYVGEGSARDLDFARMARVGDSALRDYRHMYRTKAMWMDRFSGEHGHVLTDPAWLYVWEDAPEENEFGPIVP